jgi:pectin methylesterase-like acyl-CoA thioesterase
VFIRSGVYEEIVYFRHKANVTFLGEDRERVVIGYANNEHFNGPPAGVATNEKPGTFPYRRAAFMADDSSGIEIRNLTIENFTPAGGGQAEALILAGGRNLVIGASLFGHQDTVQLNDAVYVEDTTIQGDTDFLWGRGPAFFRKCRLRQLANGPFMWVRSTAASHGFVFDRCTFEAPNAPPGGATLARNTAAYPNSEVVLLECILAGINPAAWSLPPEGPDMHYWEFRSRDASGGLVDVTARNPPSKQLDAVTDAATIAQYRDPAFVLGGWSPEAK